MRACVETAAVNMRSPIWAAHLYRDDSIGINEYHHEITWLKDKSKKIDRCNPRNGGKRSALAGSIAACMAMDQEGRNAQMLIMNIGYEFWRLYMIRYRPLQKNMQQIQGNRIYGKAAAERTKNRIWLHGEIHLAMVRFWFLIHFWVRKASITGR